MDREAVYVEIDLADGTNAMIPPRRPNFRNTPAFQKEQLEESNRSWNCCAEDRGKV